MSGTEHQGGCECGNVALSLVLTKPLSDYQPRACDCDFCQPHAAQFLSDPQGGLRICVRQPASIQWVRQGSEQAEFLLCSGCGALVAACFAQGAVRFGVANAQLLCARAQLQPACTVSPRKLAADDKVERWKKIWFADVRIDMAA